jgi:hypothetical protein
MHVAFTAASRSQVNQFIPFTMGRLYTILTGSLSKPFVTHLNDKVSHDVWSRKYVSVVLRSGGWPSTSLIGMD